MKLLLFLLIFITSMACLAVEEREQRRKATEQELSKLQSKIKSLQSTQQKNRSSLSSERQALKDTDLQISRTRKSLNSLNIKLRKIKSRLKALNKQKERLLKDKKLQQKALREQLRAAHAGGKQEYLKVLLNQENPSDVGRTLVYYKYLNQARLEKIKDLNITLEKLKQVELEITRQQAELQALVDKQKQKSQKLVNLKKSRQKTIQELNSSIVSSSKQLKEWQENERDLQSLLEALKQSAAELIPEESLNGLKSLKGRLTWPVKGKIIEKFGTRRGSQQIHWSGVIISAKEGNRVNAIHQGRVVYSDYLRGFGLISIIDHGKGYMSLYGHNEALFKQPGDWVEAGEQIATVGKSGGYPATGLYFEIRYKSKAINPKKFIRK